MDRPNDLDHAVTRMAREIAAVLDGEVYGIWLHGSVVLDDFRPGWSDIDLIALTAGEISEPRAGKLLALRQELAEASDGRYPAPRLIAGTKTHSADEILPLQEAGVTEIGENRVQELLGKLPGLQDRFRVGFGVRDIVRAQHIGHDLHQVLRNRNHQHAEYCQHIEYDLPLYPAKQSFHSIFPPSDNVITFPFESVKHVLKFVGVTG